MPDGRIKTIPFLPRQVRLSDLQDNNKLYPDHMFDELRVVSKNNHRLHNKFYYPFDIIHFYGCLHAIYYGNSSLAGASLGEGSFGKVKLVQNLETGEWEAVKIMRANDEDRDLVNEIEILSRQEKLIGFIERDSKNYRPEVVMTLAEGDNLQYLIDKGHLFPLHEILQISINILEAAQELQDQDILHRDYKPANIVLNLYDLGVKIVDFGLSKMLNQLDAYVDTEWVGTATYASPELYGENRASGTCTYNEKTEIYALGLTLAHLAENRDQSGHSPYFDELIDLTLRMNDGDQNNRPTMSQTLAILKNIQQRYLETTDLDIGFFDLDEYLNGSDADKTAILYALTNGNYAKVAIQHSAEFQYSDHVYQAVQRLLATQEIRVSNHVLIYPPEDKISYLALYRRYQLSQHRMNMTEIEDRLKHIQTHITAEIRRVHSRLLRANPFEKNTLKARLIKLQEAAESLNDPLVYMNTATLIPLLKRLAKKMKTTNKLGFFKSSTGKQNIKSIINQHVTMMIL